MTRRPFLNSHRLAVFMPVWFLGLPIALSAAITTVAGWFGYVAMPFPAMLFMFVVLGLFAFWTAVCPRCDALITTSNGEWYWGFGCPFFAHEECPKCGLDLCAVTPWRSGIIRQRKDWIASLPQPRKLWIQLGALRIVATRAAVVMGLIYGLPVVERALGG